MTDILVDLASYVETVLGLTINSVGRDYLSEDAEAALMQFPGTPPSKYSLVVSWNIQIVTRFESRELARELNWKIYNLLANLKDKDDFVYYINQKYVIASIINAPTKITKDDDGRTTYSSNILLSVKGEE